MPEAFSTPNLVALSITSKELGRGGLFCPPPTKIVLSNSPTTIGLSDSIKLFPWEGHSYFFCFFIFFFFLRATCSPDIDVVVAVADVDMIVAVVLD